MKYLRGEGGGFATTRATARQSVPLSSTDDMMEAARLQRLVHHEHVLRVLGIHNNASWPCILLELAQGGDVSMWRPRSLSQSAESLPLPSSLSLSPIFYLLPITNCRSLSEIKIRKNLLTPNSY